MPEASPNRHLGTVLTWTGARGTLRPREGALPPVLAFTAGQVRGPLLRGQLVWFEAPPGSDAACDVRPLGFPKAVLG
jgi:hypothetical protein